MDVKKEEEEALTTGPSDGPVVIEEEDADDSLAEFKDDRMESSNLMNDSLIGCGKKDEWIEREETILKEEKIFENAKSSEKEHINKAIEMALESSKLNKAQATLMREALKDLLLRDLPLAEIVKSRRIHNYESAFRGLINKCRMCLQGISPETGANPLFKNFCSLKEFVLGSPIQSHHLKRIRTIRDTISNITDKYNGDTKERLRGALYAVCSGKLTRGEASRNFGASSTIIHTHMRHLRIELGGILPRSKQRPKEIPRRYRDMSIQPEEEKVTIDGIAVPKSFGILIRWLDIGRLDYSMSRPFMGTRDELKEKLLTILHHFIDPHKLKDFVDGIMSAYLDGHSITEASYNFEYMRLIRVFIDLAKSPCTKLYSRNSAMVVPQVLPMSSDEMELPQPLPRPPIDISMDDWEVKKEEMDDEYGLVKEEPIDR